MAQLKTGTTIGGRNIVQEFDSHKNDKVAHIDYAVASGTNTYTANIQGITKLVEGLSVKIKFQNANTGASTLNINGLGAKEIRKSNGNALSSGNIKAGQILHLVYTGSVFQLLGEGGEYGTATADKVLEGYTIGTENGIVKGTLKDFSGSTLGLNPSGNITKIDDFKKVGDSYYGVITFKTSNTGKIDSKTVFQQGMYGANPEVVKAGQPIGSIDSTLVGTFTADATATASQILSGETAYVNGNKITGTMPNNSGKTQEAVSTYSGEGFVRLRPPKGYYDGVQGSAVDWTDENFKRENIKHGVTIFGQTGTFTSDATATASQILSGQTAYVKGNKITGTMPNNGAKIITPSTTNQAIPVGYHNGSGYVKGDANLKPENIKSGVSIFGVAGNVTVKSLGGYGVGDRIPIFRYGKEFSATEWSFTDNTSGVGTVIVDNNGYVYSSCGVDRTVKKIDPNGNQVWSFTGSYLKAVDNNGYVYSSDDDGIIRKISPNGNQVWSFTGHTAWVISIAVDKNGYVYSGSRDRTVKKISSSGSQVWSFTGHTDYVNAVAVDNNGYVYSGDDDGIIKKIDPNGNQVWSNTSNTYGINNVLVYNGYVYSSNWDGAIKKIDSNGKQVWSFVGHTSNVNALIVDNGYIYSCSNDRTVKKISSSGSQVWSFTGHTAWVQAVIVDKNGYVYSCGGDRTVKKIDPNGNQVWSFAEHTDTVNAIAVDNDGYVYSGSSDKTVIKIFQGIKILK